MTDLRKAAEMALEALHNIDQSNNYDAIEALRQALAQPDEVLAEREACAQVCEDHFSSDGDWCAKQIRKRGEK